MVLLMGMKPYPHPVLCHTCAILDVQWNLFFFNFILDIPEISSFLCHCTGGGEGKSDREQLPTAKKIWWKKSVGRILKMQDKKLVSPSRAKMQENWQQFKTKFKKMTKPWTSEYKIKLGVHWRKFDFLKIARKIQDKFLSRIHPTTALIRSSSPDILIYSGLEHSLPM